MLDALRLGKSKEGKQEKSEAESTLDTSGLSFTGKVAGWSARYRWLVVTASVLVMVLAVFSLSAMETKMYDGDGGAGDSAVGLDLIDERFDNDSRPTEKLVFSHPTEQLSTSENEATIQALISQLRALPEVDADESFQDSQVAISEDGRTLMTQIIIDTETGDAEDNIGAIVDAVRAANENAPDLEIGIAGNTSLTKEINEIVEADFANIMLITLVLGLGILLIAFRAVVAAIVPLVLAVGSIITATAIAGIVSQVYPLGESYAEMILLMGMAVGIDYSLFIVSRFRSERKAGKPKLEAIATASNTTGRAVLYAGITVVLSLTGLMLTNNPIFISLSLASVIVVLVAIVGSLTLLPAMLAVLGDNVNRLRLPIIGRESTGSNGNGIWSRITDKVMARPAVFATVTATVLIALATPVIFLNIGFNSGSASIPQNAEGRRAVELIEENFTLGLLAPSYVVVDAENQSQADVRNAVENLIATVEQDDAFVGPFNVRTNRLGNTTIIEVPMVGGVDVEQSESAVIHLREDIIPVAFADTDAKVYVTGQTAGSMDFKNNMYDSAPYVFGFVLGLAFILLTVMFRSIVIPVKAIVLNLLSVGAAYGVLVMVFQWGWGVGLLGAEATGMIEAWLPLFLFGILFGLSMDYHMLLLNRVKEAYDKGMSNEEAVSNGIKVTAGQITSAAAIMVGVFGAFALGSIVGLQQFGVGLGVAVLIDATIIRSVLLPASMKLLGDNNWYLPSWLGWLPKIGIEEGEVDQPEYGNPSTPKLSDTVVLEAGD